MVLRWGGAVTGAEDSQEARGRGRRGCAPADAQLARGVRLSARAAPRVPDTAPVARASTVGGRHRRRKVVLTPVGEQLRDDLHPAQRQIQQAVERALSAGRGVSGVLDVGYSGPTAADVLLRAADVFQLRNPHCQVRIHEIQLTDLYGPIRSGQVDVQVTEGPVAEPDLTAGPLLFR
ncbi:hypothetical protein C0216_15245 [Streptomyces globosus]|uniref:LysR substrate-binding domain-containing protein n=1 Tax=Streptomyces globosus TaxID=68209 RepID=A0A344U166_9ACTN|nr:hypothetical protein C0216_15245 [Streptomyces globosus]